MLAIVVAIPLVLFPPIFDQVQSSCGVQPVTATAAELPIVEEFTRRIDAYMNIHDDVERRLAAPRVFDDPEDLFNAMRTMRSGIRLACAREQLRSSQWELERLFADFYGQRTHVTVENIGDLGEKLRRSRERVVPQDVVDAEVVHTQQPERITDGVETDKQ